MNEFWRKLLFGVPETPHATFVKEHLQTVMGEAAALPGFGHKPPRPLPKSRRRKKAIVIRMERTA